MKDVLSTFGSTLVDVDLKKYNTYGIGGQAKYLVKPWDISHCQELISYLKNEKQAYYILGKGSNVILPDNDFKGVIILLDNLNNLSFHDNLVMVEAGLPLSMLAAKTLEKGFSNLAFTYSIPGTVGAAIMGNVGCFGQEIFNYLEEVTILNKNLEIETKKASDIDHSYRYTALKRGEDIILKATFKLEKGDIDAAKAEIAKNRLYRLQTQPLGTKNAGSVFKNPVGFSAGKLIDEAQLKGQAVGGAMVSEKHANFIINKHNAKSRDIIDLINMIKKEVKLQNNIDLELEQIIVEW